MILLKVSHGSTSQKYCGSTYPGKITSSSNTMNIKFQSDYSVNAKGFNAVWKAVSAWSKIYQNRLYSLINKGISNIFHVELNKQVWWWITDCNLSNNLMVSDFVVFQTSFLGDKQIFFNMANIIRRK